MATLPGALALLVLGLISLRVILGAAVGVVAVTALGGYPVDPYAMAVALAFGLVFLICDPIAAAVTTAGRWIYGALASGLVALLSQAAAPDTSALVFAALIASLFAPMIDHLVVLAHARRRRRARHA